MKFGPPKTTIGIYAGGGRIGSGLQRKFFRSAHVSDNVRVVAVVRSDPTKYIHTTVASSVFGMDNKWIKDVQFDSSTNMLHVTNNHGLQRSIQYIRHSGAIKDVPWPKSENLLVIDASGNVDTADVSQHLNRAGRVMVTAPLKGNGAKNFPHVVYGFNTASALDNRLISWASCTTNCAMVVWAAMMSKMKIDAVIDGDLTSIHAVTNSQSLLDASGGSAKKSASLDAAIATSTGFAKAAGVVMDFASRLDPEFHGSLFDDVGAGAIRIPTSTVSMVIMNSLIETRTPLTALGLNRIFLESSLAGPLSESLGVTRAPTLTTRNLMSEERTSVIDLEATQVKRLARFPENVFSVKWRSYYDNESGYVAQGWSIMNYVMEMLNWGRLDTARQTSWYSLFTHFTPELNRTADSLSANDVYSEKGTLKEKSVFVSEPTAMPETAGASDADFVDAMHMAQELYE